MDTAFNIYDIMFNKEKSYILIDTNCFNMSSIEDRIFRESFVFYRLQSAQNGTPTFLIEFPIEESVNTEIHATSLLRDFAKQKLSSLFVKRIGDDTIFYRLQLNESGSVDRTKYSAQTGVNESKESAFTTWCDNYGTFFHFVQTKDYKMLTESSELRNGMIVEIKDNYGNWTPRIVENATEEWSKLYGTLSKYQKIRFA